MNAVLRVDLKSVAVADVFRHVLVNARRTKASFRSVEEGKVPFEGDVVVFQSQMSRLVVIVIGSSQTHGICAKQFTIQ